MLIPYAYRIAEPVARSPKGFAGILERDPKALPGAKKMESEPKQESSEIA